MNVCEKLLCNRRNMHKLIQHPWFGIDESENFKYGLHLYVHKHSLVGLEI